MDYRYTYDGVGNITALDTEHGPYRFTYDALDRLTAADYPNGPANDQINASFAPNTFPFADDQFSYDAVGNRLSSQSQPGPWFYTANHELTQSPLGSNTFNPAGSTTEVRDAQNQLKQRFEYDTDERPVEVSNATGQAIARYYHDPFGRRLWKTLEPGAEGHSGGPIAETIYLAYSDEGYAAEFVLPGTPDTAPTLGPSSFQQVWIYAPDGLWSTDPIAIKTTQGWRYTQNNHLATPQLLIDGQGNITATLRANAFGQTRIHGETVSNRFPGQLDDPETGLHYNYFRSYAPALGQYTQWDPIGLRGGLNAFAYASGNPLAVMDPFGLLPVCQSYVVNEQRSSSLIRENFSDRQFEREVYRNPRPEVDVSSRCRRIRGVIVCLPSLGLGFSFEKYIEVVRVQAYDVYRRFKKSWEMAHFCTEFREDECGNPKKHEYNWRTPHELDGPDLFITNIEVESVLREERVF